MIHEKEKKEKRKKRKKEKRKKEKGNQKKKMSGEVFQILLEVASSSGRATKQSEFSSVRNGTGA